MDNKMIDLLKYNFYDDKVKKNFLEMKSIVLEFLEFFRNEYKNESDSYMITIFKAHQTRLYYDCISCQINNDFFDIFFSPKYISVEGKDIRLCYLIGDTFILNDRVFRFANGSSLTIQSHMPYNYFLSFPNNKCYQVHLKCNDLDIESKIVSVLEKNPIVTRINELLAIFLDVIDINDCVIEIKSGSDYVWFENGSLKHYNEYLIKDGIEYKIFSKDNQFFVEKVIVEIEKINRDEIINVKKYLKNI